MKFSTDHIIDIDFETRSESNIFDDGACVYAQHPSTEILMVSFSINKKKVYNWNPFTSKQKAPHILLAMVKIGYMVRAFNSEFEYWIWNEVGTRQFGWPELPIEQFYDVMAMSCAMAFPASLEKSGEATKALVQKDKGGAALINFFSKPSRKKGEHFKDPLDYPDKFREFIDYCDDDVASQIAIANKTKLLSPFEHEVFLLTEKMNVRGIPIDIEMVEGALEMVGMYQKHANKKALKLIGKDCEFESLTQTGKVKEWLNDNGCKIPNMQKDVIAEWLSDDKKKMSKKARTILKLRQQSSMTSTAKYKKMFAQYAKDGCVHGFLKYHIARTGRWGGRGIQIQNFAKPPQSLPKKIDWGEVAELIKDRDIETIEWLYDDVMSVLSGALRAAIKAPDGYKFVSADYSQIEARFVMWFADDKTGLDEFGGEGKIYEGMASKIYGIPKAKVGKDSFERFIGKQVILGSGFGMGARKFVTSCKEKGGVDVEFQLAKRGIDGYRERYNMVPKLWENAERAAIHATKYPGSRRRYKKVVYEMRGEHLYCKLPSGRELCYPYAHIQVAKTNWGPQPKLHYWGINSYTNKWSLIDTWGGKLTENFVQAAARDVMAYGMLTTEKKGYTTLFTVHDESVAVVPTDFGSVKEYEELLCVLPDWADGCPIEAEGWEGPRYRK